MRSSLVALSSSWSLLTLVFVLIIVASAGCTSRGSGTGTSDSAVDSGSPTGDSGPVPTGCVAGGATTVCSGNIELTCNADGTVAGMRTCTTEGMVCAAGIGCATCLPGRGSCDGNTTQTCNADGMGYTAGETCDAAAGLSCNPSSGLCSSPCADAEASNSYIGCEYWPTPVMNAGVANEFTFAVVVSNPQSEAADVTVTRGAASVATVSIPGGGLETIALPWVAELKGAVGSEASTLVPGGAYRLRSTLPVTVYQFNALEYRIARDCARETGASATDGQCFSFTNDASLLLPTHVMTANYMVLSRPTRVTEIESTTVNRLSKSPGFFAVIGVDEGPTTVSIDFMAHVEASVDGAVRAFRPGDNGMFTLNQGDVLQVVSQLPESCATPGRTEEAGGRTYTYCRVGEAYDLTGSIVRAAAGRRVGVISGHNCDFLPYDKWACDHLEEAMFPLEAWGQDYIVSATEQLRGEPNIVRIVSSADGNAITFDPAAVHAPITLNRGQSVEFETTQDFRVMGSEAFAVVQHLVGQDYAGISTGGTEGNGDPAFSLAIPTEQFRTDYDFLAPLTYIISYVNITAPSGATVTLDGAPVSGFREVGGTGFATARVEITGGAHHIEGGSPFGIVVYGFGSYTSYMYPGGLDFEAINVPF